MADLVVLGAAYGPVDVTDQVQALVSNNSLTLENEPGIFDGGTDPWPGNPKSLVVVYQFGSQPPQLAVLGTNGATVISDSHQSTTWPAPQPGQLVVLGAAYGLGDVTAQVRALVAGNSLTVTADDATFTDTWSAAVKTLVVVYQIDGSPVVRIARENLVLSTATLQILGATYGPVDCTAEVASYVDAIGEIHLPAVGTVLVDATPNSSKTVAVVYQYGAEQPHTVAVADDQPLTITYSQRPAATPATGDQLQILGAAYGSGDVTAVASGLVRNDGLQFIADDSTFPNQPAGASKVCTVVYRYGSGQPLIKTCAQGQQLQIFPASNYALQLEGSSFISASSNLYQFGTGDLTLEAWVQSATAGPIVTMVSVMPSLVSTPYESLALGARGDGSLVFAVTMPLHGIVQGAVQSATTAPTAVLDGQWHHVAATRSGATLSVFLDGDPLPASGNSPSDAGATPLSLIETWLVGGQGQAMLFATDFGAVGLTGALDDVRLWSVARTPAQIADDVHHKVPAPTDGLVSELTFDSQNLDDSSPAEMAYQATGPVAYVASDVDIEPEGAPYLLTQAQLMQDYLPYPQPLDQTDAGTGVDPQRQGAGRPVEISGYRVLIAALDSAGNPSPTTLTLWAADPDAPAQLTFFDGTTVTITDQTTVQRATNPQGELSFVIDALSPGGSPVDNPLVCPVIKVHAGFMQPGERLVIAPDRHVHATLAGITGAQLSGAAPLPSGKTAALFSGAAHSTASIDASAQAISQIMSAAVDHGVEPERPLTRKRDAPVDLPLPQPYTPVYEHVLSLDGPYDFASNAIATHYLPVDQPIARVVVTENMAEPCWQLAFAATTASDISFSPLSLDQRNQAVGALGQVTSLDRYSQLFGQKAAVSIDSAQLLELARAADIPSGQKRSSSGTDFWSSMTAATRFIVTRAVATVIDTEQTIEVLVVHAVDAANNAVTCVIESVEQAVDFVVCLFKKLGATLSEVVDFLKSLFDWEDILATQQALIAGFEAMPRIINGILETLQGHADAGLSQAQNAIINDFDRLIAAIGPSINDSTTVVKNQPPRSLQSKYVTTMYSDNLAHGSESDNPIAQSPVFATSSPAQFSDLFSAGLAGVGATIPNTVGDSFFASVESLLESALAGLLTALKDAAVAALGLVQTVIDDIVTLVKQTVNDLFEVCSTRIVIPYLTDFYEQTILQGNGGELSVLSLIALAAAVPVTVTYKLASGRPGPMFTADEITTLRDPTWTGYGVADTWVQRGLGLPSATLTIRSTSTTMTLAASDADPASASVELFPRLSWAMGFVYTASTAVWGCTCVYEDRLPENVPAPTFVVALKLCSQLVAFGSGGPWWTYSSDTPGPVTAVSMLIWAGGAVALMSNVDAWRSAAWAEEGDPLLTGIYGALQIYGYAFITIYSLVKTTGVALTLLNGAIGFGEAMEWIPQLIKWDVKNADYEPLTREAALQTVPVLEGIGYGIVAVGTEIATTVTMIEYIESLEKSA